MRPPFHLRRPRAVLAVSATVALAAGALVTGAAAPAGAHPAGHRGPRPGPVVTVLADGLHNPRHLVVDRRGAVYVAEAGRGAADPASAPCLTATNPETGQPEQFCYGATGAIARWKGDRLTRVVTGLPSVAGVTGDQAGGVTDLTVPSDGRAVGVVGLGGDPRDKAAGLPAPAVASAGHLLRLDLRRDRFRIGPDVSAFEAASNPDAADPGSAYDSNPYAVAGVGRGGVVVADAGGNDLLRVDRRGRVSLLAVFPARTVDAPPFLDLPPGTRIPMQAVPNSVVRGPDGAWYVGQLTGFPFPVGAANVYRVRPGQEPAVVASGFTNVIDVAFDDRGRLLVLEIASTSLLDPAAKGSLWVVDRHGRRTLVTGDLEAPGGVVAGHGRTAYVTNRSVSADGGQLLRVRLPR